MSERARRTKMVFDAVVGLRDASVTECLPGDVVEYLRAAGTPYDAWEVRGELTNLERLELIVLDANTATWRLVEDATFSIPAAKAVVGASTSAA